jgi:hypothetical protein
VGKALESALVCVGAAGGAYLLALTCASWGAGVAAVLGSVVLACGSFVRGR